ncbi:fructosamine 3 kinase [Rhizophlyctis rosea]|nr:fructosamine 3 kinase [Rhizophlyctis rosea]
MHAAPRVTLNDENEPNGRFGFPVTTMLGSTLQDNTWEDDYITFWRERRLRPMLDNVLGEHPHDAEIRDLGDTLVDGFQTFFKGIEVQPALLHGDLWGGNWGVDSKSDEPVIFDPACYYGHNEAELSIMKMFGGSSSEFFEEYHRHMPKQPGFATRQDLYQLHHYLNHMYLFGTGYRSSSVRLLKFLVSELQ